MKIGRIFLLQWTVFGAKTAKTSFIHLIEVVKRDI